MTGFKEYDEYDALGLAELVANKDVSADELLEEAIERTERINPAINAVVQKHYDEAGATIDAGLPNGPFTGVPFLLKDLGVLLKGTVSSMGSVLFKDFVAPISSTLTDRYIESGVVIFGKTNSPEFGSLPVTEPRLFGPTRNPWNTDRTPGGSSGGSSAAVAAGIVPMANASDGGGSIRIPASCTGLVGLKPTRGRTPFGPILGEAWAGQAINHVVSKTVRDSAAMLDATAGAETGDPYEPPYFNGRFLDEVGKDPGKLRIALCTEKMGQGSFSEEVDSALHQTATLMLDLGHEVEEATPAIDMEALGNATRVIISANTALMVKQREQTLGRAATDQDIEPITRLLMEMSGSFNAEDYATASQLNHMTGRVLGRFHEQYDLILAPTLSLPPVPIGFMDEDPIEAVGKFMADTALFNQTGQPSISLPLAWSEDGLPLGMMFSAAFGNDALLIRLSAQLEQANPWINRRPPHHAGNIS
jgi:amidase